IRPSGRNLLAQPLFDKRENDGLERLPFSRVGKNDRPESAAIDLPLGVEHTWAEALDHPLPNLLLAKGLMPRPVTRNHPRAALGKRGRNRALATADAANQTDHDFRFKIADGRFLRRHPAVP